MALGPRQLGGAKGRQVLLALVLHHGASVSKGRLVELLWGAAPPDGAIATLEAYVSLLRKRLDTLLCGRVSPIRTTPGGYCLDVDGVDLDIRRFDGLLGLAREPGAHVATSLSIYASALDVVQDPLLPEEDLWWLDELRRVHETKVLRAMVEAAEVALGAGQHAQAERWAGRALERDQFSESAWLVLLRSFELRGQHAEGLRAYVSCRGLFASELGCAPGPRIRAVFAQLLRGTDDGADDGLGDLVDAVVRLHLTLVADREPERAGARRSAAAEALSERPALAFEDDFSRLHALLDDVGRRRLRGAPLPA